MPEIALSQQILVGLIFIWSGFVRTGLGFGGAALALPLMLFIYDNPVFWLPIVASHLLIFSSLNLYNRLHTVDWVYLKKAMLIMIIPKMIGVFGLLNLPSEILVNIIYTITFMYGLSYVFDYTFVSDNRHLDKILLILGAYASGTSLIGAPLISAVFTRHVALNRLRETLFVLWFILVVIKMSTFVAFGVDLHIMTMFLLLPCAAVGHFLGLKAHSYLIRGQGKRFKSVLGLALVVICGYGLVKNLT